MDINDAVTLQEQIAEHHKVIAMLTERVVICDVCNQRKSAAYWRAAIVACESAIRACERRMEA